MKLSACLGLFSCLMLTSSHAFILPHTATSRQSSRLHMAESQSSPRRRPTKTVQDRTPREFQSLVQDIIKTAVDAGPRAGPARTFQAYLAVSQTFREFLPRPGQPLEPVSFPKILRSLFERLGATYIKLGQFIASSPTLFPKEYVLEFQKCLDSTDPLDWAVIEKVIVDELGPISNTFEYVDKKPLASASIAQVHAAKLKTGEDVVLKVQKPGIDSLLKADLGFVYVAALILEFISPDWERTSLSAVAGDIRVSMMEETDFVTEAKNTEEFRDFLLENGLIQQATAPRVYQEFTTKKVLTMERLRGVSLLDEETIAKASKDSTMGTDIIITALNIWSLSVVTMPWFHADVHAGNLMLCEDGRVGFIDFGIVGRVSKKTYNAVNELSTALASGDYEGMAEALCNMGAADEKVDKVQFGKDIERVMDRIGGMQADVTVGIAEDGTTTGSLDLDETEITNVLLELVEVTEDNGLKLPREFGLLVKQSLYFDRYIKILAPNVDVMSDSRVALGGKLNGEPPSNKREVVIDV
ncbi:protein kinase UbiB [Seminavis robusta]|uniref:Protein kinase UbiB n=1 Tax=Seminavis robusta TaxID=568900 RepID=A0A9N8EF24_9STRA|nr:protein kinase UbiB [Seminavis robusta]|eukprot:Sro850_g210640.1 protein kinase UbiB (527) ;mRNA; f:15971-17644